jgi:hypothetical protein
MRLQSLSLLKHGYFARLHRPHRVLLCEPVVQGTNRIFHCSLRIDGGKEMCGGASFAIFVQR